MSQVRHPFRPDYAIPPGTTLRRRLEEIDISQADLAERTGFSRKHVNQIIQGIAPITHETAVVLERVTGTPASLWNALEANYRATLLRSKQDEALSQGDKGWLRSLPIKALQDRGVIPSDLSPGRLFDAVLSFFGVADRLAWERLWMKPAADFRRSEAFKSSPGAVAAWIRLAELEAREVGTTVPYSAAGFRAVLQKVRALTIDLDSDRLVEMCASVGVVVVFVREIDGCRLSGATWWVTPTRAVIALSDRYKSDDFFWFTFFHEAAHLLLHSKKETFVDDGENKEGLEAEADRFAADLLIPPSYRGRLATLSTEADVRELADELGLAPGIIVGRLHHDGTWGWNRGNKLRRKIYIVDE